MSHLHRDLTELRVISTSPFNAETVLEHEVGLVTPVGRHYVRNHFQVPTHDGRLRIDGSVAQPLDIRVMDL